MLTNRRRFIKTGGSMAIGALVYQVGTITDVKTHQIVGETSSDVVSYDVSLKVGDTIYLVLIEGKPIELATHEICCRNPLQRS